MKKVAVIIKHPLRDGDWRVDVYDVEEGMTDRQINDYVMSQMLGPFEVIAISHRVSFDNTVKLPNPGQEK